MSACPLQSNVGGLERLGCLVFGSLFLLNGVLTRRTSSAVLGGLLAYRGLTGNCRLYEALNIDTRAPGEKNTP